MKMPFFIFFTYPLTIYIKIEQAKRFLNGQALNGV